MGASRWTNLLALAALMLLSPISWAIGLLSVQANTEAVQSNSAQLTTTSLNVPFTKPQTRGNMNFVAVAWDDTSTSLPTVTDSQANTYIPIGSMASQGGYRHRLYYAPNIKPAAASANTVTVTTALSGWLDVRILEYSGVEALSPLDNFAQTTGTTTSITANVNTTTPKSLIISATTGINFNIGCTTGDKFQAFSDYPSSVQDRIVTGTGLKAVTCTQDATGAYILQAASFKAIAPPPVPPIAHVQSRTMSSTGTTAINISPSSGFTAGNFVVVAVLVSGSGRSLTSPLTSDSGGNTYQEVNPGGYVVGNYKMRLFYARNVSSGSPTISLGFTGGGGFQDVIIAEYSGMSSSATVDTFATNTGSGAPWIAATPAIPTGANQELLIGFSFASTAPLVSNPDEGYVPRSWGANGSVLFDKVTYKRGNYSSHVYNSSGGTWLSWVTAFKP